MKKTFNKQYILDNKGCYEKNQVLGLPCINKEVITLRDLSNCLPVKDLSWFFVKKCELTLLQKQMFAIFCAELALPIYEKQYPNDSRVKDCIEETKLFLDGKSSIGDLKSKHAADAAYAAAAAAYAADAADAAYAAAAAADAAAAYAAAAADAADIKDKIKEYILDL